MIVISVVGDLDMETVPELRAYLADRTAPGPSHLVLDLSGVSFLSSHGLSLLIEAYEGHSGSHGELHLTGVSANRAVERVLDLTGMTSVFDIHDDRDELLRELAG